MLKRNIKGKPRKKKGPGLAAGFSRGGQSTVEYIILVAAVIGALLIFLPGTFRTAYNATLVGGTDGMEDMANRLSTSRPLAP